MEHTLFFTIFIIMLGFNIAQDFTNKKTHHIVFKTGSNVFAIFLVAASHLVIKKPDVFLLWINIFIVIIATLNIIYSIKQYKKSKEN